MCGIVGIIGDEYLKIKQLNSEISHRGPDAQNTFVNDESKISFGHTRLSIIDLDERSNQPFISACGNYHLVFNGEIYNYESLSKILLSKGYEFTTTSDTEVLLYWLIENGLNGVEELDGMFSFAFYNKDKNKLLMCRDHIGEKPLYYSYDSNNFAFCSEMTPILNLSWVDKRLNKSALKNYLFFLYSPPPNTLFNGIKEVFPGQALEVNLDDMVLKRSFYFVLEDMLKEQNNSNEEDVSLFKECFKKSIKSRLKADVRVGMFLSGGLDSNAIVAQAIELNDTQFSSYTMSYSSDIEATEYDESRIAKLCADFYGIENTLINLHENESFSEKLDRSLEMFGSPFGNATSLVSDILSKSVSSQRKVCLVGDGGDELLAGYPRYKALNYLKRISLVPKVFISILLKLIKKLPESGVGATKIRRIRQFLESCHLPIEEAYLNWVGYSSMEAISKAMDYSGGMSFHNSLKSLFKEHSDDPIKAASLIDFKSFVPYNLMQSSDRTSMQHGLELRSPFLAKDLVMTMINIGSKNKLSRKYNKPLLVYALKNILPVDILNIPKKPFNPPMRSFMGENIKNVRVLLCSDSSLLPKLVSLDFIEKEISGFDNGTIDNSTYLWGLCSLETWLRHNYPDDLLVA